MEGGRAELGRVEALGEVDRLHDLRELALAVGLDAVVVAGEHQVVEVERGLAGGCDHHDARGREEVTSWSSRSVST